MADRRKAKEKEPEDDYDFFAPHPHPTPDKVRVKQSFFDYMPDAYVEKSIQFTESPKKVKKQPVNDEPKETTKSTPEPEEKKPEPVPVEETLSQVHTSTIEANPWDTSVVVSIKEIYIKYIYIVFVLSVCLFVCCQL